MLRKTVDRLLPLVPAERQVVVTGRILGDAVRAELPELPPDNVLEEPTGRNTAPAIAWAAAEISRRDPDALLAILPADQLIVDEAGYRDTARRAIAAAAQGRIVTLGITPTRPETGYGYIRAGAPLDDGVLSVSEFKEKPPVLWEMLQTVEKERSGRVIAPIGFIKADQLPPGVIVEWVQF